MKKDKWKEEDISNDSQSEEIEDSDAGPTFKTRIKRIVKLVDKTMKQNHRIKRKMLKLLRNWKRALEFTKDCEKAASDSDASLAALSMCLMSSALLSFEETWNELRKHGCLTKKQKQALLGCHN